MKKNMNNSQPPLWRGPLSPLVHLANNWISLIGVILVTTATIFWLFLLPTTMKGVASSPYIGILTYMGIPAVFFFGLALIPFGIFVRNRSEHASGLYPANFPPLSWQNGDLRRLVKFVGITTIINVVVASQVTYAAISYMDTAQFCGTTCHTVMQPEYTAYQNSPHSRVDCVSCHIGAGATWFVRSKLSGTGQVIAVALNNYPRPIPSPVHNLRPARETCETCHWPQRYSEDKLRIFPKYAEDQANTRTETVMMVKVGGGNKGVGIHGTHLGPGIVIRYGHSDEARQNIPWIEYNNANNGTKTLYLAEKAKADASGLTVREMDCMDCHNRPAHAYQLPDRAVDDAMFAHQISAALPFVKKKSVELLKATYASRDEAAIKIPAAFEKFYQDNYPTDYAQHRGDVVSSGRNVLAIYNRNIFPEMKVTWGKYPLNLGHTDFPGCFRCHDDGHKSGEGKAVTQDCGACHNMLAVDEAKPKILTDLGLAQ
jgi:nitrate/TMAO reductase-like tetraheme cytochrome c subunit